MFIQTARQIAQEAHRGQTYDGEPFFDKHTQGVVRIVELAAPSPDYVKAAYLHDVVEDSEMRLSELHSFDFSDQVISAVAALTRLPTHIESYSDYIHHLCSGSLEHKKIARLVKWADLTFNFANCLHNPEFQILLPRYQDALTRIIPLLIEDHK